VPVLIVSLRELEKVNRARSLEDFGSIDWQVDSGWGPGSELVSASIEEVRRAFGEKLEYPSQSLSLN